MGIGTATKKPGRHSRGKNRTARPMDTKANGTGPFMLQQAGQSGEPTILRRHDQYWRKPAKLETVTFRVVPNDSVRLMMLQAGDADFAYLEQQGFRYLKDIPGIKVRDKLPSLKTGDVYFFTFEINDLNNPYVGSGLLDGKGIPKDFFQDKHVRKGFAYLFDAERYFKTALESKGVRANGPVPISLKGQDDKTPPYPYDLVKAKKHLQKAQKGQLWQKGFELGIAYDLGNTSRRIAAEILRDGLNIINDKYKVNIYALPKKDFIAAFQARKLPLFISGFTAEYPDAQPFIHNFFHSQGFYGKIQGQEGLEIDRTAETDLEAIEEEDEELAIKTLGLDGKVRKIFRETSHRKRIKRIRKLERQAVKKVWQIYTYYPNKFMALRDNIKGADREQSLNALETRGLLYYYPIIKK